MKNLVKPTLLIVAILALTGCASKPASQDVSFILNKADTDAIIQAAHRLNFHFNSCRQLDSCQQECKNHLGDWKNLHELKTKTKEQKIIYQIEAHVQKMRRVCSKACGVHIPSGFMCGGEA